MARETGGTAAELRGLQCSTVETVEMLVDIHIGFQGGKGTEDRGAGWSRLAGVRFRGDLLDTTLQSKVPQSFSGCQALTTGETG